MLTNNNFVSLSLSSGMGQAAQAGQFNPVEVKQEPVDGASAAPQESIQEHSLDLSKKDHRYPIILPPQLMPKPALP